MKSIHRRKKPARGEGNGLSRREFARGATLAAAAVAAMPGSALGIATAAAVPLPAALPASLQQAEGPGPKLTPAASAEVEAKISEILRRYGDRLDEAQKKDIRRLVREGQAPLEALRAYPLENSDEPATILHLPSGAGAAPQPKTPAATKPAAKPGA